MLPATLWTSLPTQPYRAIADETPFEWIQSTEDPGFKTIREDIDAMFLSVPPAHRSEYESRLKSKTHSDFYSAYCELWYARELTRHGLPATFPIQEEGRSLPDLVLLVDEKQVAIAECRLRMPNKVSEKRERRLDTLLRDTFGKILHKDIRVKVHHCVPTALTPSARDFATFLENVYSSNPPEFDSDPAPHLELHRCVYDCKRSGWSLDVTVCKRNTPDNNPQLMLLIAGEVEYLHGADDLEDALQEKASQHPSWQLPQVICLGWNDLLHSPTTDDVCRVVRRLSYSLVNRGVLGVFFADSIYPWTPSTRIVTLYHWNHPNLNPVLKSWTGAVCNVTA